MLLLRGKSMVVTGVGPGFGRAFCLLAAEQGARVAVSARSPDVIEAVASEIRAAGGEAIAVRTDVRSEAQCLALAEATRAAFGAIDGLVNSARARNPMRGADQGTVDDWARVMDVNCYGALRMSRAVLPAMKERGGSIVNIGTIASVAPVKGEADYSVAKAAMGALVKQLANEWGAYGIRVNMARMGWMWGPSIEKFVRGQAQSTGRPEQEIIDEVTKVIPLRRIPTQEECAQAVMFLLSDYATVVTGTSIDVNGGHYMAP